MEAILADTKNGEMNQNVFKRTPKGEKWRE